MAKKLAKDTKAKAGVGVKGKKRSRAIRANQPDDVEMPEIELPENPNEQIQVLEAAIAQEKELEKLVQSCTAELQLPQKLQITRLQEVDKSRSARAKGMELALKNAQAVQAGGSGHASKESDTQADFGLKAAIKHCEDPTAQRRKKAKKTGQANDVLKLGKHLLK